MDRDTAQRLVGKLREVREDRGATAAEARTAKAKADRLTQRFGLKAHEAHARPASRAGRWTAPARGPAAGPDIAEFLRTGKPQPGLKVHRFRDRANWKIEIEL